MRSTSSTRCDAPSSTLSGIPTGDGFPSPGPRPCGDIPPPGHYLATCATTCGFRTRLPKYTSKPWRPIGRSRNGAATRGVKPRGFVGAPQSHPCVLCDVHCRETGKQIGVLLGGSGDKINGLHLVSPRFGLSPIRRKSLIGSISKGGSSMVAQSSPGFSEVKVTHVSAAAACATLLPIGARKPAAQSASREVANCLRAVAFLPRI